LRKIRDTANLKVPSGSTEERLMDFNTGSSGGEPDDRSRPMYGGETGGRPPSGPPRGPAAGSGAEFNLQDPVGSFIRTARGVLLNPVNFFRGITRRGDFLNPAIFALICALISALLSGILSLVFSPFFAAPGDTGEALVGGLVGFIVTLILSPIYTAIALLIGAGVYHLLVLLLARPTNAGFEATFRVVCYVAAIQLVSWIPIVNIVAGIYGIVLSIFGIREVHNTTTGRAAAIVLIPVAVIVLIALLLAALIGAALFFGAQQQQL
jgi:hypothetical protein